MQAWGPGIEFGWLRVSPAEIYWYGYFRHPEGAVFPDEPAAAASASRPGHPGSTAWSIKPPRIG